LREFDIGFVPHGWTRGEPLRVCPVGRLGPEGLVERDPDYLFAQGPSTGPIDGRLVGHVRFRAADERRVAAWVQWWNAESSPAVPRESETPT
jgi:hypothetical protein